MNYPLSRRLPLGLMAAAVITAISAPVSAYTLHSDNGTEFNLDVEALLGVFSSRERYNLGAHTEAGSINWQEGYLKLGLSGSQVLQAESSLYGGIGIVSSATWGSGDAGGFTSGNERKTNLETAYVGWQSGNLIPALGENGMNLSFGRQPFAIGDGFLINGDALNFGDALGDELNRGGAYWLAPRQAFDRTAVLSLGTDEGLSGDLFWLKSDNVAQSQMKLSGLNLEYGLPYGTFALSYIRGLSVMDGGASHRDGQKTTSLRYQGDAGVENLFLSGEWVTQTQGDDTAPDAKAWYLETGWTFADLPFTPSITYRYSRFEEGFDPLFFGFSRGYGTWFQGEVAANYAGPFNSDAAVHHIGLAASLSETLSVGALYFDFSKTAGGTGALNGRELDLYAEWVVNDHLIINPLIGVYRPKHSDADGGSQIGGKSTNLYGQLVAVVLF
ncbi:hypothetical protein [Nitrincola alkalilacustris]|uniref:hypothetical protein n=1 Tax=Nitrincola alkalilacustris TaxID=1571224 RepID=UPI001981112B|nr:hypothetical protein [Nitrincola alkalilacustris]